MKLLIYTQQNSNRFEYCCKLCFEVLCKVEFQITTNFTDLALADVAKIAYTEENTKGALWIKPSGLLIENGIRAHFSPTVDTSDSIPKIFPNNSALGFDVFAAVFYLVSRYEEYNTNTTDSHHRFLAQQSIAFKHQFLEKPIVHIWHQLLLKELNYQFPKVNVVANSFKIVTSIDVDRAYAFKGNHPIKNFMGALKKILTANWTMLRAQWAYYKNAADPFDSFDYIFEQLQKLNTTLIFFILIGDKSSKDNNLSHHNKFFKALIKSLKSKAKIGLHPSYFSIEKQELTKIELQRLVQLSGEKIDKSRQHFLRFNLPDTFNRLEQLGVLNEYSMGYSDTPGFRAGISIPFPFFDLKNNITTHLIIHPFAFMDIAYYDYLKWSEMDSLKHMLHIAEEVKAVNGTLCTVWHNHSINNAYLYPKYMDVFKFFINSLR